MYTFPHNLIYNDNSKWDFNKIELSGQTGITPAQPARSPWLKEAETKLEAAQKALDEMAKAHALRDAFDVVDSRQSFVISICNFQVEHAGSVSTAHTASRRLIRLLCFRFELVRSLTHHFHLGLGTG